MSRFESRSESRCSKPPISSGRTLPSMISNNPFFFTALAFSRATTAGVNVSVSVMESAKASSASVVVRPEAASSRDSKTALTGRARPVDSQRLASTRLNVGLSGRENSVTVNSFSTSGGSFSNGARMIMVLFAVLAYRSASLSLRRRSGPPVSADMNKW